VPLTAILRRCGGSGEPRSRCTRGPQRDRPTCCRRSRPRVARLRLRRWIFGACPHIGEQPAAAAAVSPGTRGRGQCSPRHPSAPERRRQGASRRSRVEAGLGPTRPASEAEHRPPAGIRARCHLPTTEAVRPRHRPDPARQLLGHGKAILPSLQQAGGHLRSGQLLTPCSAHLRASTTVSRAETPS